MNSLSMFWTTLVFSFLSLTKIYAMDPKFDPSTRMRLILVPADAAVGSVIYRLRATDEEFDYPLAFELLGDISSSTVQIESLPCTKYNSVCQANVVLQRRLEPGRYYDFQVSVKDTKGGMALQSCSLTATNFTTPHDFIFPHKPGIIMIPEDAKRGTELDYVIARKNPQYQKPVYLELWGSPLFAIRQKIVPPEMTEGTIFLLGPLDFEKQAMYHLTILANDAYAEPGQDTRNIAGLEVVVIVQDVQDMPPIFTAAPPVTRLPPGLLPGDKILQVHAEDGDKGSPRELRYGLVSEGNPFTSFFDINETTGEIFLLRPLDEISAITHIGDPVLLTIVAEEVKVTKEEPPAMSTTVQIAFLLPERSNSPPYFENDMYVARIEENSPQGTALIFPDPYIPMVSDDDTGKNGVFSLTLLGNNGTFEITPNVAERRANFLIHVRDNQMLDYEMFKSLHFQILAQELGPATNLSATANVTVYIEDVNDNPPIFSEILYMAELPENMTAGTRVVQVHAEDIDTGDGGKIRYTQILGYLNTSLNLDAATGLITVSTDNHGFDREQMPEYHFYIEVRDDNGNGNHAQVPLVLKLIDVNDEAPIFEKPLYEFILAADLRNFTVPAFIRAIDGDAEPPNNVVRYEIMEGNFENKFFLNTITGELILREPLNIKSSRNARNKRQSDIDMRMFSMTARAFDLGVPVQWSTTTVKVYPPESQMRTVMFIVPGLNPNKQRTEASLSELTGGRVTIQDIRTYTGNEPSATDIGGSSKDRSVVTATILYDGNNVVDVEKIQKKFITSSHSEMGIVTQEERSATLYKAENRVLFWLLIFLAVLMALIILTLLFCCICSWCPLYGATRKRVIRVNSKEDDVHLVHREQAIGKQTKSVQVAEWMGRREAWSAEKSASDPRTKSTRWEFSRRNTNIEKLGNENSTNDDDSSGGVDSKNLRNKRIQTKQYRAKSTTTEIQLHNSRTNLINERDGYMDDETMRRHELERGSDMEFGRKSSLKRPSARDERDQLFIKEGNAEILRLITRGKPDEDGIYINVPQRTVPNTQTQPQYVVVDNSGGMQPQSLPNEVQHHIEFSANPMYANQLETMKLSQQPSTSKQAIESDMQQAHSHQSIIQQELEMSLKQQNALLRQILLDKEKLEEKENALETQSLPCNSMAVATTQTDHDMSTQTEAMERRRARSENDDSMSEEEYEYIRYVPKNSPEGVYYLKKKKHKKRSKYKTETPRRRVVVVEQIKRKIRTPIQEENEDASPPRETKSSLLRRLKNGKKDKSSIKSPSLKKDILLEISDSLDEKKIPVTEQRKYTRHTRTEEVYDDGVSSEEEVYDEIAKDSLEEPSEDEKPVVIKKKKIPTKILSQGGSSSDLRDFSPDRIVYRRESSRERSVRPGDPTSPKPTKRVSRRDTTKETVTSTKTRRQTASEPPYSRSAKGPAPKPPDKKYIKALSERTRSEMDILKKLSDEGFDVTSIKGVPRYMEWYFKKDPDQKDDKSTKSDKSNKQTQQPAKKSSLKRTNAMGPYRMPEYEVRHHEEFLDRDRYKPEPLPRTHSPSTKSPRFLREDIQMAKKFSLQHGELNHPLIQHSEHRFENDFNHEITPQPSKLPHYLYPETPPRPNRETKSQIKMKNSTKSSTIKEDDTRIHKKGRSSKQLNASTLEDDHDSGIAMNSLLHSMGRRNPIADKKSVFTIAYDDVKINRIRSESDSPNNM